MGLAEGSLPLRKDGQIETRPLDVEEWLETLPYADFQRTGQQLHQAMAATNKMPLKASAREALHELYSQPYRYYLESQIRTGAQHTLASMETMQQQLRLMKQLAADLSMMNQLIINDAGKSKSLWGRKPPVEAVQRSMTYLSQALIFNFLEYGPTPRNVWKQLHSLYRFAESIDRTHIAVALPGGGHSTVAHTYARIILTEQVDPYHLPFGGVWEVYEQVDAWLDKPALERFEPPADNTCRFVIDLDSDSPAMPCDRFDASRAGRDLRLLDVRNLQALAQQWLEQVLRGVAPELRLSSNYRRLLLEQMSRAWYLPPKRYLPRNRASGELPVSCGLKPTHFHMNHGRDLLSSGASQGEVDGLDVDDEPAAGLSQTGSNYTLEQWNMLNESTGGYALSRKKRPLYPVHVGDLVGLKAGAGDNGWRLGIVRWLMADSAGQYRMGVQILASDSKPAALRINGGREEPQRGFRISRNGEVFILTARGVLGPEQTVEVVTANGSESFQTVCLVEEMAGSEQFSVRPQ